MNQYKLHNPFFEQISIRKGTLEDELILHLYLELLGYKAPFLDEWFIEDEKVYQIFHISINKQLLKKLWKGRDKLFREDDFNNPIRGGLFNKLRSIFWIKGNYKYPIDSQWKTLESKNKLKQMKSKLNEYLDFEL